MNQVKFVEDSLYFPFLDVSITSVFLWISEYFSEYLFENNHSFIQGHKPPSQNLVDRFLSRPILEILLPQSPLLAKSVRMRENKDQNNSEYRNFLRSVCHLHWHNLYNVHTCKQ